MNEPPGARARVALTGLAQAEYFRDEEGKDVLLFIDNIFRFTQAGSEVSALLGRIPSAVGYQPTLATEMGNLQERITSTNKGSITSVQAIYVPADDLTDPAPATSFAHLDATTVLSRDIAAQAIFPAVDPLDSTSRIMDPLVIGEEHYNVARRVQEILQQYKALKDIIAILGHGRAVGRGQADRRPRAQDLQVPVAAVPRGRAVHQHARRVRQPGRHHPLVQGGRATASTTTCRKPPSTWSAPSRTRWPRPRSWRRKPKTMADKLHFSLVSPERELFSGAGRPGRCAGLRGRLRRPGRPRAVHDRAEGGPGHACTTTARSRVFEVRGGFADVTPDGLTVLAEHAVEAA